MEHVVKTLVRTGNCRVDQCSCGAVHVSVAGTTVRIKEEAARELFAALGQAFVQIDQGRRLAQAPTPGIHLVPPLGRRPDDDDDGGGHLH
ncbi:MAG: hypothetical protein KC431_17670 [Myxococcales bacterium]|nr:hypothetical protein [Myxococcales bacterium]